MPDLSFKLNTTITFSTYNLRILEKAKAVFFRMGYDCIVTGGLEGNHMATSFHYRNMALDFRSTHIPADEREAVHKALCLEFGTAYPSGVGANYDVFLEGKGTTYEHYHCEADEKQRRGL